MWIGTFLFLASLSGHSFGANLFNSASEITLLKTEISSQFALSSSQFDSLLEGDVFSYADVDDEGGQQKLKLFVAGLHPRDCNRALKKISRYENYHTHMDFIKKSTYDENSKKVFFLIDHTLLPFAMTMSFIIPRVTKPGDYPFTFDSGFLKDLKAQISVRDINKKNQCLLTMKADWIGAKTKIPNIALEAFAQTLSKIGLEHLIRVSRL